MLKGYPNVARSISDLIWWIVLHIVSYMARPLIVFVLVASIGSGQQGISNADARVALYGRVTSAQTKEPVRRAAVKIYSATQQWDELTDSEGRFKFPPVARAEYGFVAHRDGYSDSFYKIELSDFDKPTELLVAIFPRGIVSGRVLDHLGHPLQGARIEAFAMRTREQNSEALDSSETNDLGEYRLSGLDPGMYRIRATYREGRSSELDPAPLSIASAFYGGSDQGSAIAVKAGVLVGGIDFELNPVRPAAVRGKLRSNAETVSKANLWVIGTTGEGGHNAQAANGNFEIDDLAPGSYVIFAEANGEIPLSGTATFQLRGEDVEGVEVVLEPVPRIPGQVQVQGGDLSSVKLDSVYFMRSDHRSPLPMKIVRPDTDGSFNVFLDPGEYTLTFGPSTDGFDVQQVLFGNEAISNWKLSIDASSVGKKLLIAVTAKRHP